MPKRTEVFNSLPAYVQAHGGSIPDSLGAEAQADRGLRGAQPGGSQVAPLIQPGTRECTAIRPGEQVMQTLCTAWHNCRIANCRPSLMASSNQPAGLMVGLASDYGGHYSEKQCMLRPAACSSLETVYPRSLRRVIAPPSCGGADKAYAQTGQHKSPFGRRRVAAQ